MSEARATLVLEVVDLAAYQAATDAARKSTEALTAAQKEAKPIAIAARKAKDDETAATKRLTDAEKAIEKAYRQSLAPHEKTALLLEETLALKTDSIQATTKQAVAVAHLSAKLDDQTRRFEMNRGEQNKLSRSLAELLDEQTKQLLLGDKVAGVTTKMGGSLGMATAAAGLAVVGVAALVAGLAATAAALVANSAAADENNEALRAYGLALDEHGTRRVNRAAAALDTFGVVSNAVSVAVADTMAPGMEFAGTRVAALGLMAVDAWRNFAAGKTTLEVITELVAKGLVGAFNTLVSPIKNVALGLALLSDTVGITDDAAINLRRTFDEWTESLEASTADGLQYMVKAGLEPLIAATGDYMAQAGELVTKQEAINRATRDGAAAATEAAEAWELYRLKAVGANEEILKSTEKTAKGTVGLSSYAAANQKADVDEVKNAAIAALEQEGEVRAQQIAFGLRMGQQAAATTIALIDMVAGESARASMAAFVIQQAAALAGIGVATAENISKAAALFAFPSPPGIAAVAAASALGAAQAAVVVGSAIGSYNSASPSASAPGSASTGSVATSPLGNVGGGANAPTASAVGMGAGTSGGRGRAPLAIPSSDGFFPASMGARTIQTAPGDEVTVQRGGALNRDNQGGMSADTAAMLARMGGAILAELRGLRQDLGIRRYADARMAGPAVAR